MYFVVYHTFPDEAPYSEHDYHQRDVEGDHFFSEFFTYMLWFSISFEEKEFLNPVLEKKPSNAECHIEG
jgi:hypothetical protein